MQRASIEAAAALMSSGNSRNTKRTLPVSRFGPQHREDDFVEGRAMWATHRGIFGDGYRRFRRANRDVRQRSGFATAAAIALCA